MIDAVPEKKVVKINVTIDDDINLILDAITKVESAFVMLVLPEGNDLANSPIGLKALRKKTLEKAKRMVLVMPKGSAFDLAKKAGFIASTSQEAVTGDVWQTVIQQFDEYKHTMAGMNSRKELPRHLEGKVEYMAPVPEHLPVPEIVTGGGKVINEEVNEHVKEEASRHIAPPKIDSEVKYEEESPREKMAAQNITGMDFSKLVKQGKPEAKSWFGGAKKAPMSANTIVSPQEINSFHPNVVPKKVGDAIAKVAKKKETSAFVRFLLLGLIGIVVGIVGVFAAYYYYFPKIRIDLQIQSNALSITDSVLATSAVTGFDVNRKEIQMTKEKVEKNATQSFDATEKGSEGVKATGTVTINNTDAIAKTIPSGTVLIATSGKKFVYSGADVSVDINKDILVTAIDMGEEYNMPASTIFSVTNRPTLTGQNAVAFTGGTKREFTVVSQKDVDKVSKELQTELGKQGESDLSYLNLDKGFEFIKESVKTELKGKATITPAVGAEVKESDEQPSVAMFTTTTALYYHSESLTKLAERLLLDKYRVDKNLSAEDSARTSIEELAVKVEKITLEKDDKVTISFTATGLATSRLDAEKIRNDIVGKKWVEMLEYLGKLPALARSPEVRFYPVWLPDFARYVPSEVARIDVGVKVVVPETPTATPTPTAP